jgi:hypothetical protein
MSPADDGDRRRYLPGDAGLEARSQGMIAENSGAVFH